MGANGSILTRAAHSVSGVGIFHAIHSEMDSVGSVAIWAGEMKLECCKQAGINPTLGKMLAGSPCQNLLRLAAELRQEDELPRSYTEKGIQSSETNVKNGVT